MLRKRGCYLLTGSFAFVSLWGVLANAGSPNRLDHAWKQYRNTQWGYCVSYPSRWYKGDAFEGSGLLVETGSKKFSKPVGEIDVEALAAHPADTAPTASLTLVDDFKVHLEGLAKFERAERMEVLDQRPLVLGGKPALFTKDRYYDPLERATWIEELVFAHRGDVLYRLEMECRADEAARFEPVFTRFIDTFQFDCAASH
jgi:hypothetical protein